MNEKQYLILESELNQVINILGEMEAKKSYFGIFTLRELVSRRQFVDPEIKEEKIEEVKQEKE